MQLSTQQTLKTANSKIAVYCHELLKAGFREQTIQSHGRALRFLSRNANLEDPESIREFIASRTSSGGRKENLVNIYAKYAEFNKISFSKPRYQREDTLPKIPLEQWLLDVINAARSVRHAATLRGLYETGARVGEWCFLTHSDFDFHRKVVRLAPEKHSKARECKLSETLLGMVEQALAMNPDRPFPNPFAIKKHLHRTTGYLAKLNGQPGFLDIHAHTFRHFRATKLYWETKDILFVKNFLGHRSISSTMKYLQLADMTGDEHYMVKATMDAEEAVKLLEQGFVFSNNMGDIALYRKRK